MINKRFAGINTISKPALLMQRTQIPPGTAADIQDSSTPGKGLRKIDADAPDHRIVPVGITSRILRIGI